VVELSALSISTVHFQNELNAISNNLQLLYCYYTTKGILFSRSYRGGSHVGVHGGGYLVVSSTIIL
jgi:hypothetical protein